MLHVVLFTRKRMCLWGISKIHCSTEVFRTLLIFNEGNMLPKLSVGKKQKKRKLQSNTKNKNKCFCTKLERKHDSLGCQDVKRTFTFSFSTCVFYLTAS